MNDKNTPTPQISVRITNPMPDIVTSLEKAITGQKKPPTAQIINLSIVITPPQQRSDTDVR